jgi:hypothetical protein
MNKIIFKNQKCLKFLTNRKNKKKTRMLKSLSKIDLELKNVCKKEYMLELTKLCNNKYA